jgi:hypothetical protein
LAVYVLSRQREDTRINRLFVGSICLGILAIMFSLPVSKPLWQVLPTSFIQFPFRILSYLILSSSFLTAYVLTFYEGKSRLLVTFLLLIITIYASLSYSTPKAYFDKGEGFYATNEDTTTVKNEYMPVWVQEEPKEHAPTQVSVSDPRASVQVIGSNANFMHVGVTGIKRKDTQVILNKVYYPGWTATYGIADTPLPISYTNQQGVMEVTFPENASGGSILFQFTETPLRMLANSISLITIISICLYGLFKSKLWNLDHQK